MFKVKKSLTPPLFKLEIGVPRYFKVLGALFIGKAMVEKDPTKKAKDPATLMSVLNLETGEEGLVIANHVIASTLRESYPNDTYVGHYFAIVKQARTPGKQYDKFGIDEIEDPAPAVSASEAATSAGSTSSNIAATAKQAASPIAKRA